MINIWPKSQKCKIILNDKKTVLYLALVLKNNYFTNIF